MARYRAKGAEMGVGFTTLRRRVSAYDRTAQQRFGRAASEALTVTKQAEGSLRPAGRSGRATVLSTPNC